MYNTIVDSGVQDAARLYSVTIEQVVKKYDPEPLTML